MRRALIVDRFHEVLEQGLADLGYDCTVKPSLSDADICAEIEDYEVLIVRSKTRVDRKMLEAAKKLKYIGRAGSGMENIDFVYARTLGIECYNSPEGNCDAVGEQVVGCILALLNNLVKADSEMKQGNWVRKPNTGLELGDMTVGIYGFGHTGSALARKLSGFSCKINAYDKYREGFGNELVREVSEEVIFRDSDIVSFHTPLTEETQGMLNKSLLARFAKPIFLVNASRGPVAVTADLIDGLDTGRIKGLALDVFENENFDSYAADEWRQYERLSSRSNVILTPHIAGWTTSSEYKIAYFLLLKIGGQSGIVNNLS